MAEASIYGDLTEEEFRQGAGLCRGGKPSGCWIWWHGNGVIREVGAFIEGKRDGLFTEFDECGKKVRQRCYSKGELDSGDTGT